MKQVPCVNPSSSPPAGFSIMIHLIARQIPDQAPKSGAPQLLSQLQARAAGMREANTTKAAPSGLPSPPYRLQPSPPPFRPLCTSSLSC